MKPADPNPARIHWLTDRGMRVVGPEAVGLARRVADAKLPEVEGVIPADGSLLIALHHGCAPSDELIGLLSRAAVPPAADSGRRVEIPVRYGGDAGPDLRSLAQAAGLCETQAARLHASVEYRVLFLGFQPGFPYLAGTPPRLCRARQAEPRCRVPAGSVAIGDAYTGIYPCVSPGGWWLIGRTELALFDATADPPTPLVAGDRVRFIAV